MFHKCWLMHYLLYTVGLNIGFTLSYASVPDTWLIDWPHFNYRINDAGYTEFMILFPFTNLCINIVYNMSHTSWVMPIHRWIPDWPELMMRTWDEYPTNTDEYPMNIRRESDETILWLAGRWRDDANRSS